MQVEFVGANGRDTSSLASNPSRLFNVWGDRVEDGGRAKRLLRSVPGMVRFATLPDVFVRDMLDLDGTLYSVAGNELYAGSSSIGSVDFGDGNLSRNYEKLTLTSVGKYYVWNGSLTEPTPGAFTSFGSVEFLAGRTLLTEKDGSKIQWSDIADPSTLPGLNVASAESRSDAIIRGMVSGGLYYVLGEKSTEVWAATGSGGAGAFALLPGMVQDIGLKAFGLVCRIGGGLFLVGNDGIVYLASGTTFNAISIAPVSTAITDGEPDTCLYWEYRGHKFAAITFKDRPAWVYCFTTGEWFERGETTDYLPWRARVSVKFGDDWLVGADDGGIYTLSGLDDDGEVLLREATSLPVYSDSQFFTVAEFEAFVSPGFVNATLMLEVQKDGQYGLSRSVTASTIGGNPRAVFRALGRAREFVFRVGISDPVEIDLWSAARLRVA